MTEEDRLSHIIIGAAIEVHKTLGGPGLLESVYEEALVWELEQYKLKVDRQKAVPIKYKVIQLAEPLRLDVLVEECVIVECKAVVNYNAIFEAQALTYLRLMRLRLALVINFGSKYVRDGIKRVINDV